MRQSGLLGRCQQKFKNLFREEILGLDIGEAAIKLTKVNTGWEEIVLDNMEVIETPPGTVEKGKLKDIDRLSSEIKKGLARKDFKITKVVTAVSGEKVISRTIELPNMSEEELDKAVRWEAREQVPISIEEGILDYEILAQNSNGDYQLLIIAVKKELIDKYLKLFEKLELEPLAIETEPIALGRAVSKLAIKNTVCIIDLGERTTDISIVNDGQLLFTRTIAIGGRDITEEIAEKYDLSPEDARKYKENNNLFKESEANRALRNLTTDIYRSLDYFAVNDQQHELDKVLLTGGGGRLEKFDEHLGEEFDIEISQIDFSDNLSTKASGVESNLQEVAPLLTVSIGLGLRKEEEL